MSEATKHDSGKTPWHLLPSDVLEEVAKVMGHGEKKYGRDNWAKGMAFSRPFSALMRHTWAWWRGETNDPESRLNHLAHGICCLSFLLAYQLRGMKLHDDRERIGDRDERALQVTK